MAVRAVAHRYRSVLILGNIAKRLVHEGTHPYVAARKDLCRRRRVIGETVVARIAGIKIAGEGLLPLGR